MSRVGYADPAKDASDDAGDKALRGSPAESTSFGARMK